MKSIFLRTRKSLIVYLSVFSVLASSIFSVFSGIDFSAAAAGAGSSENFVWSGEENLIAGKVSYAGGSGTAVDPYLISNGDQFYKMAYENGKTEYGSGIPAYFKLINNIYLNDVTASDWYSGSSVNKWSASSNKIFEGTLDGGNFTVYGLHGQLFTKANGATIKNLNIAKAYTTSTALLIGTIPSSNAVVNIEQCSVHDSVISNNGAAMVGLIENTDVNFKNCSVYNTDITGSKKFGFVNSKYDGTRSATSRGKVVTLTNCISIGFHPASYENNKIDSDLFTRYSGYEYVNSVTDVDDPDSKKVITHEGVTGFPSSNAAEEGSLHIVAANEIKGISGQKKLKQFGFDFAKVWKAVEGDFPVFRSTEYWTGYDADTNYDISLFKSGTGTATDPFIITNADQLLAMIKIGGKKGNTPANFKLANDIYLNDVKSRDISDVSNAELNNWLDGMADETFVGKLDGDNNTVFGLYANSTSKNSALIPKAGGSAVIKNLTVANSSVTGAAAVGGIIAFLEDTASVTLEAVAVVDSDIDSLGVAGGIVGAGIGAVNMSLCYTYDISNNNGAFYGITSKTAHASDVLTDCYSAGAYPVASGYTAAITNVYTDDSSYTVSGVTSLGADAIKGETALDNMLFSKPSDWLLTSGYPITRPQIAETNTIWDGTRGNATAVGSGTEKNPYMISTAAQLYDLVADTLEGTNYSGKYFKLSDDIYLNSVVYDDWYSISPNVWNLGSSTLDKGFAGTFDGDGHFIYGLYIESSDIASGLFPVLRGNATVKNTNFDKAYLRADDNATDRYIGTIAGFAEGAAVTVSKCFIDTDVQIGAKFAGGIVGGYGSDDGSHTLKVESCAFAGGFITDMAGNTADYSAGIIGNCFGTAPAASVRDSYTTADNAVGNVAAKYDAAAPCYQLSSINITDGLIGLGSADNMFGNQALLSMSKLDWGNVWNATAVYPTINLGGYAVWSGVRHSASAVASISYAPNSEGVYGDGSEENPYIIRNAEQLYKMVAEGGKGADGNYANFKVADGVTAIYLNDIAGMTKEQAEEYLKTNGKVWSSIASNFRGRFDGNGCTIYGLYANTQSADEPIGLFATLGHGAYLYNFTVKNAYVVKNNPLERSTGIIAQAVTGDSNSLAEIKNVAVIDSYVSGTYWVGGFVGSVTTARATFENCLVAGTPVERYSNEKGGTGGILGDAWGGYLSYDVKLIDCISLDIYPVPYYKGNPTSKKLYYEDVYTDFDISTTSEYETLSESAKTKFADIIYLTRDKMTGTAAPKENMKLVWGKNGWRLTENYPVPDKHVVFNGNVGGIWSGKEASYFAQGTGSKSDPYIIDTPERLYKAINEGLISTYYQITEDIYLNNIQSSDWYTASDLNIWSTDSIFNANISGYVADTGDIKTVYGLYNDNVTDGNAAALIPVIGDNSTISNINISNSYFAATSTGIVGAVVGITTGSNVIIGGCMIEPSVIIESGGIAGGVLGLAQGSCVIFNCGFTGLINIRNCDYYGGLIGKSEGAVTLSDSYSAGVYAAGSAQTVTDVYSNIEQSLSKYAPSLPVTFVDTINMLGANSETYMSGLDFENIWSTTQSFPRVVGKVPEFNGTPGEVWSGICATSYAGGTGTEEDPYLISTGEQLYKMASEPRNSNGKHFKITHDIKLNDVTSEKWKNKQNLNSWYGIDPWGAVNGGAAWEGHLDGDYHIVYGLYFENYTQGNVKCGLISYAAPGAVVENVGIDDAYIVMGLDLGETTAAGIIAYTTDPYREYKKDENGNYLYWGDNQKYNVPYTYDTAEEWANDPDKKAPVTVKNCMGGASCVFQSHYSGGIVGAVPGLVVVDTCLFTGTVTARSDTIGGAIVGDSWGNGSHVSNCFSVMPNMGPFCGGSIFTSRNEEEPVFISDCYYLAARGAGEGAELVYHALYNGKNAVKNLTKFDWENTWTPVEDGTPVLTKFLKNGHKADEFSLKGTLNTTFTFVTNYDELTIDPISSPIRESIDLPTLVRYGYEFGGWHVYPQCDWEYDYGYMPYRDLTLYAKWTLLGIFQNFENYPNTDYDLDEDVEFYRPGSTGYKPKWVMNGAKGIHRKGLTSDEADFLVNYEEMLEKGTEYELTFWMCTDVDGTSADISLVQNTWPDVAEPISSVEKIVSTEPLKSGEWKQYTYKFTAENEWISIRTSGNASLFFDDIMITPIGETSAESVAKSKASAKDIEWTYLSADGNYGYYFADSAENAGVKASATAAVVLVSAYAVAAVLIITSRKNLVEVIENEDI